MAQNKRFIFPSLLIVLIFAQEIQFIHGRHLKLGKKNVFLKLQAQNKMLEKETRKINNAKHNNNLNGYVFPDVEVAANANLVSPPEAPSVAVGETLPPPPPRHVDAFRPTAPGHSPGVGHFLGQINNAKHNNNLHGYVFPAIEVAANANLVSPPEAPSVAVGETLPPPPPRHVDDFRPTAPGHSPGIGHSLQN